MSPRFCDLSWMLNVINHQSYNFFVLLREEYEHIFQRINAAKFLI